VDICGNFPTIYPRRNFILEQYRKTKLYFLFSSNIWTNIQAILKGKNILFRNVVNLMSVLAPNSGASPISYLLTAADP
jgi:hypothetical protein